MKNKIFYKAFAVISALIAAFSYQVISRMDSANPAAASSNEPITITQSDIQKKTHYPVARNKGGTSEGESQLDTQSNSSMSQQNRTLKFEDDWCFFSDLIEEDFQHAHTQLDEWNIARGTLNFSEWRRDTENDALASSYMEIENDELLYMAKSGDDIARIAILSRWDIPSNKRLKNAQELLIRGKTGKALSYLVSDQMATITTAMELGEEFTEKHKNSLINALMYANFGLERYDSDGLLTVLSADSEKVKIVSILSKLSPEDMETVDARLQNLKKLINQKRLEKGYSPLSSIDIPKIAKHKFESDIALWNKEFGEPMRYYKALNTSQRDLLEGGECSKKIMARLAKH